METTISFFSTAPRGMESILADELINLGARAVKESRSGVRFQGSIETAYRACLWLRTANRVLMPISEFNAVSGDDLYAGIQQIDWFKHINQDSSFAVDFYTSQSGLTHSYFGALRVKDAIVDQFRNQFGRRPSVNLTNPDIRVNIYLLKNHAVVSLDFAGESLHRRGYRTSGTPAPLKENLAAAILIKAGWQNVFKEGGGLIDPMCGSGTLPIEAALMAADAAPGLLRTYFGFMGWKGHQPDIWQKLIDEAEERETKRIGKLPPIIGYDASAKSIAIANECLQKAGLHGIVHFEKRDLATCEPHPRMKNQPGLIVLNPPYGMRIGETTELIPLYSGLGSRLKQTFQNWQASLFTGNVDLGKSMGIRAKKMTTLYNGAIKCKLLNFEIQPKWFVQNKSSHPPSRIKITRKGVFDGNIQMFVNRLRKNIKKLGKWAQKEDTTCYRVYDKDLPEYAVSIDIYNNFAHIQEYKAPNSVNAQTARIRLQNIVSVTPEVLNIPAENVFLKVRERQKGASQYQKQQSSRVFHEVEESGNRFLVNLTDYLDTGLFLDHRLIRQLIGKMAKGKRFLNLFAYTGTATVYAAKGGAKSTTSIDLSQNYLNWARRNLALNGFSHQQHILEQSDSISWMKNRQRRYDLILLDPPTFSNSKRLNSIFDIQKDHVPLIKQAVSLLTKDGLLIFSNNNRKFKMDLPSFDHLYIKDITRQTIPADFERNPKIHNCWLISPSHQNIMSLS